MKMVRRIIFILGVILGLSSYAMAALTPEEVSQLGGDKLTVIGAEKAGNADGSIPPYTGGITEGPDGWYYEGQLKVPYSAFKARSIGVRPNPFKDDKILYTITASNLAEYDEFLTDGTKELFKRFPDYKMNVYPSRRSCSYGKNVIEGTRKSALTAKVVGEGGKSLIGAHCGFPFPIPKSGIELVWNHLVRWVGTVERGMYNSFVVNSAGRKVLSSHGEFTLEYPYWDETHPDAGTDLCKIRDRVIQPANRNGEGLIWIFKLDKTNGDPAWQYLPGQRSVKRAPEIAFDGPNTSVAGAATYDESYVYNGSPERFEWKIVGKKEMLIPYNQYELAYHSSENTVFGPKFINPDYMRWEKHRVWVLEGTLKPEYRHIFSKRIMYLDEDSWYAVLADTYDHKGNIYRVTHCTFVHNYDYPAPFTCGYVGYDLIAGIYYYNAYTGDTGGMGYIDRLPSQYWAPQALAGAGIR
ncbi:MAG: DUF1329 domain-containing protein [Desulfomonilia bacterium]